MSTALRGVPFPLQPALSTTDANGKAASVNPLAEDHVIFIKGTGTITSGVITIEEADTEDYSGTWSSIQAVNGTDVTAGAIKAIHLVQGIYRALRARISTNIGGGGSVEVIYVCN